MKKFISAVSALAMAASMFAVAVPASVSATADNGLEQNKTLSLRAISETTTSVDSLGNSITVSAADIAAGDVTIPCAMYIESGVAGEFNSLASIFGISDKSADTSAISLSTDFDINADYYAEDHTFATAWGDDAVTKARPFFNGECMMGMYFPYGDFKIECADTRDSFGITLPTISTTWVYAYGDTWLGEASDSYPYCYFDVTLKKGATAGDYVIDFYDFYKDDAELQPSNLLGSTVTNFEYTNIMQSKTGEGMLNFEPLTITVEGDTPEVEETTAAPEVEETTAAPEVEETTAAPEVEGDGIVFSYGAEEYEGTAGGTVTLQLFCNTNGTGISSVDGSLLVSDADVMEISKVLPNCMAAGTSLTTNTLANFIASGNAAADFTDRDGNQVSALYAGPIAVAVDGVLKEQALTADKAFLVYQVTLADDIADGVYTVEMPAIMIQGKSTAADEPVDWIDASNITKAVAKIRVGDVEPTTEAVEPTTEAVEPTTEAPEPTTEAVEPTTAEPTPEPTLDPNGRMLGDSNVNGVVNVADVVVLNKYLAGKGELTDQGKVNAEVSTPTYDVASVDLTTDDSTYIIKSIIHLYDLTADGPVATEYNK